MPRGDRTGPMGEGAMTGRSAGFCAGYDSAGCDNPGGGRGRGLGQSQGQGRGLGQGRGMRQGLGRGMRYGAPAPSVQGGEDASTELQALRGQVAQMQNALDSALRRLDDRSKEEQA